MISQFSGGINVLLMIVATTLALVLMLEPSLPALMIMAMVVASLTWPKRRRR